MSELAAPAEARLDHPRAIEAFPLAETIDVAAAHIAAGEPSPCIPTVRAVWYVLSPDRAGTLVVDLTGSTVQDAVVRLYRRVKQVPTELEFVGCASPVWNGQLGLEARVHGGEMLLAQIGTSSSTSGRLVVRAELRA